MAKHILGVGREPDLVDELRLHQLGSAVSPTRIAVSSASNWEPITAAAFNVRLATLSSRSMRAAIAACKVAGTLASAAPSDRVSAALAAQHPAVGEVSDDLLGEERVARRPLGDLGRQRGQRRVRAQQLGDEGARFRIIQRGKRNRLRAGRRAERPAVFGPVGDQHQRLRPRERRKESRPASTR